MICIALTYSLVPAVTGKLWHLLLTARLDHFQKCVGDP